MLAAMFNVRSKNVQKRAASVSSRSVQRRASQGSTYAEQAAALKPGANSFASQQASASPRSQTDEKADKKRLAQLATAATEAAVEDDAKSTAASDVKSPLLRRIGDRVGLGLGILVTRALKYVPSWNTPIVDDKGEDVHSIPGAEREGDHKLTRRHAEFVGPKILSYVETMSPGRVRDFLLGFGEGAKRAPGETYRREVDESE